MDTHHRDAPRALALLRVGGLAPPSTSPTPSPTPSTLSAARARTALIVLMIMGRELPPGVWDSRSQSRSRWPGATPCPSAPGPRRAHPSLAFSESVYRASHSLAPPGRPSLAHWAPPCKEFPRPFPPFTFKSFFGRRPCPPPQRPASSSRSRLAPIPRLVSCFPSVSPAAPARPRP